MSAPGKNNKSLYISSVLSAIAGAVVGAIVTAIINYFIPSQSFTFTSDGKPVVVTESSYKQLIEENKELNDDLQILEEEIQQLQDEILKKSTHEEVLNTVQAATEYWNKGEHVQALSTLKNCGLDVAEISILYEQYSNDYCKMVLATVDSYIENRDYNEAQNVLKEAQKIVKDSTKLDEIMKNINANMPISLSKLKASASIFPLRPGFCGGPHTTGCSRGRACRFPGGG